MHIVQKAPEQLPNAACLQHFVTLCKAKCIDQFLTNSNAALLKASLSPSNEASMNHPELPLMRPI
jgi:hypothetical protein